MPRVRVKICGITRREDGESAAEAGVDALGFVFAKSPRAVTPEQAAALIQPLPPFVTTVGLFVDADPAFVRACLAAAPLDLLQFHGAESAEYCAAFGRPYLKALRVRPGMDVAAALAPYGAAAGWLLDAFDAEAPGGTGQCFDWSLIPRSLARPVVLAGGLSAANVAEAIAKTRPYAVDVSSGVEQAKGLKDAARISAFIKRVAGIEQS